MAYDLGDPVPLTITITNSAGQLANAGQVALTVTKPDGTQDTFSTTDSPVTIFNPDVGTYQKDYFPATVGRYVVNWAATGINSSAYTDTFDVNDPASVGIISLQDARTALRLSATVEDEELRGYLEATTVIIERHLGQVVVRRPITEVHRVSAPMMSNSYDGGYYYGGAANSYPSWYYRDSASYGPGVTLNQAPVISLTSAVSLDGSITWDVSQLHLDANTGLVTPLPATAQLWGPIVFGYVAGYTVIPAHFQQAARFIIQDLWSARRGGTSQERVPGGRAGDVRWSVLSEGPGMRAALELLGPPLPTIA